MSEISASPIAEFTLKNSQRRVVYIWLCLMVGFVFSVFLPTLIGLDGFNGGFALSFFAAFMVIISLVVILIYHSRANMLDRILHGEGKIAVWHYAQEEWNRFVSKDYEEDKKLKTKLFLLIAGISVIIGCVLAAAYRSLLFAPIILALIAVVAIPAILAPRYRHHKLLRAPAQVLIAENGVIIGTMFHLWVKLGARLDEVTLKTEPETSLIEFRYSIPTRNGRQEEIARVPVPYGKTEEAARIVRHFNMMAS